MMGTLGVGCRLLCLTLCVGSGVACSLDVEYLRSGRGGSGGRGGTAGHGGESVAGAGVGGSGDGGAAGAGGDDMTDAGDGRVDASIEDATSEGDSGEASDARESGIIMDASVCAPGACKRVFVSDKPPAPSAKLGSVATVDAFCQSTADGVRLGGLWKAWLSDASTSPSVRFARANVPYVMLDGTMIAANWTTLTSSMLMHAIDMSELGRRFSDANNQEVWTGTTPSGVSSGSSCANWTNETRNLPYATIGVTNANNGAWTNLYDQFCDRTTLRVYCFEQ